jgi:hypothetical protein
MSETGADAADDPGSVPTAAGSGSGVEIEPADAPEDAPDPDDPSEDAPDPDDAPDPSWWHRSHPTFAGLVGFFVGVAYVVIVPGVYAALLGLLVSESTAKQLFPLVLVALVIPLVMLVSRKTRRFAEFMFLGIVSTVVVVAVTTTLVIWVMVKLGQ